jgi:small-conductance mechanosensitive channel
MGAAVLVCAALALVAASPSPQPSAKAAPRATASAAAKISTLSAGSQNFPDQQAVIAYLSQVIGWYRHLGVEERLVSDPAETLFVADDRQMANEVLNLSFEFARAESQLLARVTGPPPAAHAHLSAGIAGMQALADKAADADDEVKAAQAHIKDLQDQLARAGGRRKRTLESEIAAAQSQLDLAEARSEALHSVMQFEGGGFHQEAHTSASGLAGQIEELEKSVPEAERNPKPVASAAGSARPLPPRGILGIVEDLFALSRDRGTLDDTIALTNGLAQEIQRIRAPLIAALGDIDRQGDALAKQASSSDLDLLRQRKADFEALIERHKLVSAATIPLTKANVILTLYTGNIARWRAAKDAQWNATLRHLIVRLIVLAILLAAIFAASLLWRQFTFRYVQDARRRYQFLQARRIVVAVVVALVLIFNFANEIGALATVMGFAAAGIAVALQNVILSVAGYFFLIGKFGIKVGDRVQVSGVSGDVIDIGLVKLSLMELGGDGNDRQPTGRVVVFSNAIVFQPNGNFFKQIPGTNFVWNEVSLMLAPECDYRLAEKRLLEAVDEVFARYREAIQRQYIEAERSLNMVIESPKPQSRLQLSRSGLQVTLRYPVEMRAAVQTADEVSRRLMDAINREPTLRLVAQATANIQPAPQTPPGDGTSAAS